MKDDIKKLLEQTREEIKYGKPSIVLKGNSTINNVSTQDALKLMKQEVEDNKSPKIKYVDKFKDRLLTKDYKDLVRKVNMFDLREDEIDQELRLLGIVV